MLDRGYKAHHLFDQWQQNNCFFICRIKGKTQKHIVDEYAVQDDSHVFFDAKVLLGTPKINQTKKPLRLVGYIVDGRKYWVATDRFDIIAEQIVKKLHASP